MKISLHLGAHKTASTFLQHALERNGAALAAQGVHMVPYAELRRAVTRPLAPRTGEDAGARADRQARAKAFLDQALATPGADRVILSDENLIGEPAEMVESGTLYPTAAARLAPLAALLAGHEVEILLAVRQMGDYSRSLYCEALGWMTGEFTPEALHRANWAPGRHSWVPVVQALLNSFPAARVAVWPHMFHSKMPRRVLDRISSTRGIDWSFRGAYRRPSLSTTATRALIEIGARGGTAAMRAAAADLRERHPVGVDDPVYAMWRREEIEAFVTAFRSDIRTLRSLDPRVEVVTGAALEALATPAA